ncbi:MAG: tRNA pseudouridine(55) synthase TruB [Gammaproteobacteria bacterium]
MAIRRKGLDIHGILLLDKRIGVSSNQALQEVKRLLNANKAGHTGSLDPLATGLLPLCFGEATKVSAFMLDDDKRYRVTIRLGIVTDTGDTEGRVLSTAAVPALSDKAVADCLAAFSGAIDQVPPMYSALKQGGRKLYELARQGKTVERAPRRVEIYAIELTNRTQDSLELDVRCSKGTYIRSLAFDIGVYLGCGATVAALRRIQAGRFRIDEALTFERMQALPIAELTAHLIAADRPLQFMPAVELDSGQSAAIKQGRRLDLDTHHTGQVRMYDGARFLGLGEMLLDGKLAPKKLFNLGD